MSETADSAQNLPMGHGVKQRDLIRMTDEEIDAFLACLKTI